MWRPIAAAAWLCWGLSTPLTIASERGPATTIYENTDLPGSYPAVESPELAYDAASDRVLAVWVVSQGSGRGALLARVLDRSGQPVGETFALPGIDWPGNVSVVVTGHGRFLVAGSTMRSLRGCEREAVHAVSVSLDGSVGPRHLIAPVRTRCLRGVWWGASPLIPRPLVSRRCGSGPTPGAARLGHRWRSVASSGQTGIRSRQHVCS